MTAGRRGTGPVALGLALLLVGCFSTRQTPTSKLDEKWRATSAQLAANTAKVAAAEVHLTQQPSRDTTGVAYTYRAGLGTTVVVVCDRACTVRDMKSAPTPKLAPVIAPVASSPPPALAALTPEKAEGYKASAIAAAAKEGNVAESKVKATGGPVVFGDEAVFFIETAQFKYSVSCNAEECRIQASEMTEVGKAAWAVHFKINGKADAVEVGEPRELSDGSRLYEAKAEGKKFKVQCYDDGPHFYCSTLDPGQAPYIRGSTGSTTKCKKGCPCGNACIDCSKTCRK